MMTRSRSRRQAPTESCPVHSARPQASSPAALRRMQAARRRDTAPEMALRVALHRRGLRYRVDAAVLDGIRRRADLVFSVARVAIFVDGCFWHGCPLHGTWPKANATFWRNKIMANKQRDADTDRRLRAAGWQVLRFWEHDDLAGKADRVEAVVRQRATTLRRAV